MITLFGYRVPMMASLLVWGVAWEIAGRLDMAIVRAEFEGIPRM